MKGSLARILLVFLLPALGLCLPCMAEEKEWTFIAYINADNSLDEYGTIDQDEMAKVGSNESLNIVTMIDGADSGGVVNFIEKGKIRKLRDVGEPDMGDYRVLVDFVKNAVREFPARHYALVIWSHGSGWKNVEIPVLAKGISPDDTSGTHITPDQLGVALSDIKGALGRKLDILAMDACLMQMMEVAWLVKDSCDLIVASEEKEPPDGMEYVGMLEKVGGRTSALDLANSMLDSFDKFYEKIPGGWQVPITLSILDSSKLGDVKDCLDGLAKAALSGPGILELTPALEGVMRFSQSGNMDLQNFVAILLDKARDESLRNAAQKLSASLKGAIVRRVGQGCKSDLALGLAIYFPAASQKFSAEYSQIGFCRDTLWDQMIVGYYKKAESEKVVSTLREGNSGPMEEFIRTANRNNAEVSRSILERLNFLEISELEPVLPPGELEALRSELRERQGLYP